MSKIQKAIVNFRSLRAAAIIPICEFIIASVTGNAFFPTPTPKLSELQAVLDSYTTALSEAASRDRNKVALKNQLRKQLNAMLNQLGTYVNMIADGDVTMIISSGFPLSKLPQPRYISAPQNLTVKQGQNPGTLVSKINADAAAKSYIHMITLAPLTEDSVWTSVTTSRSQYEFSNLQPGKEYFVKVAITGTKDQIAYSAGIFCGPAGIPVVKDDRTLKMIGYNIRKFYIAYIPFSLWGGSITKNMNIGKSVAIGNGNGFCAANKVKSASMKYKRTPVYIHAAAFTHRKTININFPHKPGPIDNSACCGNDSSSCCIGYAVTPVGGIVPIGACTAIPGCLGLAKNGAKQQGCNNVKFKLHGSVGL